MQFSADPTSLRSVLAVCLALAGIGCANETSATHDEYDDVAEAVGGLISDGAGGGEVKSFADSGQLARGSAMLTAQGEGKFEGEKGGLTYSYEIVCKDGDNVTLDPCTAATQSASVAVDWQGDMSLDRFSAAVNRSAAWTVTTAWDAGETTFDGIGSFDVMTTFESRDGDATASFDLSYSAEYEGVKINWESFAVMAGHIGYEVSVDRMQSASNGDETRHFDVSVDVEFVGKGKADIVLDGDRTYSLNLTTGSVTRK